MKTNVGNTDRALRIAAGIAILAWGYFAQSWLGLIGIVPLLTGVLRWCPAYCPFGISTTGGSSGSCCSK
ncbi:MAG: DUF2892 domain-containing protein [Deltaproteobacteria bacterium]|nr:DUF2892 domain-containing protein [Deltaproteobacteria bacterium]